MRLASTAKAGFYPTPPSIVSFLISRLEPCAGVTALDPCCGTGDALARICGVIQARGYGIELEAERAREARTKLGEVRTGDALRHEARGFSLLYLNPPYDTDAGERLERRFLAQYASSLLERGLLVLIVPESVLPACRDLLEHHFFNLGVWRFPPEDYAAYRQVIVTGFKRSDRHAPGILPEVSVLEAMPRLALRAGHDPLVRRHRVTEAEQLSEAASSPLWDDLWQKTAPVLSAFRPLHAVREGHLALLVAAGMLNGVVVEGGGRRLLVRGLTEKTTTIEEGEDRTVEREQFVGAVVALDLDSGEEVNVR